MNGKDGVAVFERQEHVERRATEQFASQQCAPMIGRQARGDDKSQSSVRLDERQRALDEELIQVGVSGGLQGIDAGPPRKSREICTRRSAAAVRAQHLPRRIAQHRVETRTRERCPRFVVERLWKFERPVKEVPLPGGLTRVIQ